MLSPFSQCLRKSHESRLFSVIFLVSYQQIPCKRKKAHVEEKRTEYKKDENESLNKQNSGSDIGPVLNWNPQTGSLQISQSAMHKLLASLGGHVTQRKNTGLTVFFPISEKN